MLPLIRRILSRPSSSQDSKNSSAQHVADMTHDDARQYYEDRRNDPAAIERQRSGPQRLEIVRSTDPICPACDGSLGNRKPPQRRSRFKCKHCTAHIYADPKQELFASVYLTEKQKDLVDFLWQLDNWVFTAGTIHDFCWARAQIGKADAPLSDNVVSDTIWYLLNYNLNNLATINPGIDKISMKPYRDDLLDLMQGFREAQKEWRGK